MMMMFMLPVLFALAHLSSAAEVCCGSSGCFNDNAPFNIFPLPTCATNNNVKYTMFTRTNRNAGQALTDTVIPAAFVASRRTVFISHGWNSDGTSSWLAPMKNAFLDREDINVVIIDWGNLAQILNYAQAASNTRTVGAFTSLVIRNLLTRAGTASSRMWCNGHSLGSHVCGHTGMKMPANQRLGRVTGMDPAGPLFETSNDKTVGINPTAATFVDILHTDAGELGATRDLGHIDFYPTGGKNQPGCVLMDRFREEALENWDSEEFALAVANNCAHSRAYQFFQSSIANDCFHSRQRCTNYNSLPGSCSTCTNGSFPCAYMGYAAESSFNRSGIYYLTVSANSPYCTN
jgi:hypothetical protein